MNLARTLIAAARVTCGNAAFGQASINQNLALTWSLATRWVRI